MLFPSEITAAVKFESLHWTVRIYDIIIILDYFRSDQTIQHPDVVPCVMRESTAPPDVCKDTSCPATDGETFVDTEKALDDEYNCSIDGQNLNSDNNEQLYTSDKEPSLPKERSMSAKINISQDSYSDTLSRCSYSYKSSDSYLASSYSSQSGSEAVYSSSAGGTSSTIDFDRDSSTHCDHRLKLFLEMKFFRGEEPEEFRCMIKVKSISITISRKTDFMFSL